MIITIAPNAPNLDENACVSKMDTAVDDEDSDFAARSLAALAASSSTICDIIQFAFLLTVKEKNKPLYLASLLESLELPGFRKEVVLVQNTKERNSIISNLFSTLL